MGKWFLVIFSMYMKGFTRIYDFSLILSDIKLGKKEMKVK